ncbi:hypothetical protein BKA70DRAFT_1423406 [Coprinopsis sp. MPI-PUGE-AT-0042]|nr:hypothetical protein BKA70DRAFT_1423406 [Coprinopsis sp. MPI-PUGE-AT-0042]
MSNRVYSADVTFIEFLAQTLSRDWIVASANWARIALIPDIPIPMNTYEHLSVNLSPTLSLLFAHSLRHYQPPVSIPTTMNSYQDLVDTPACHAGSRSLLLPRIFEAPKHPLHPAINPGRTFVALIRATETAMEEMKRYEDGMSVPLGQGQELASQGLVEMVPGDYLFARDTTGTGQPTDDALLAWAVGPDMYDDSELSDLEEATWQAIGDKTTRSSGSTRIETLGETTPVQPGSRCYTLAQSFEAIPAIVAPCASRKWKGDGTDYLAIVRDLIKATSRLAMANMKCATPSIQEIIRERSTALGLPHIGHDNNYAYPTIQCNIASASKSRSDLSEDMGDFGSAHRDERDSVGHFTNMIANSKLPSSYDPGYFHLLLLGVYVSLQSGIGFNFQGHWKHGGSAPTCPPSDDLDPSATRFVLVSYPPSGMVSNQVRHRVAELPRPDGKNDALYLTPEMKAVDFDTSIIYRPNRRANFMSDGHVIMEPRSYAESMAQLLYNEMRFQINQSPTYIGLHIDPIKFFQSFSYETLAGGRETVGNWDFAPESRHGGAQAVAKRSLHVNAEARWKEHVQKTAKVVPYCFAKFSGVRQQTNSDIVMVEGEQLDTEQRDVQEKVNPSGLVDATRQSSSTTKESGTLGQGSSPESGASSSSSPSPSPLRDARGHSTQEPVSENTGSGAIDKGHKPDEDSENTDSSGLEGRGKEKKDAAGKGKRKRDHQEDEDQGEHGRSSKKQNKQKIDTKGALRFLAVATVQRTELLHEVDFKFTNLLTASVLEAEVYHLRRSTTEEFDSGDMAKAANALVAAGAKLDRHPFDLNTLQTAWTLVWGCKLMEEIQAGASLEARKARLRAIDAQVRIWRWLDGEVRTSVIEKLDGEPTDVQFDLSWVSRLADAVTTVYTARIAAKVFDPEDFGINSRSEEYDLQPYTLISNRQGRYPPSGERTHSTRVAKYASEDPSGRRRTPHGEHKASGGDSKSIGDDES